jgi:hypothetical protein
MRQHPLTSAVHSIRIDALVLFVCACFDGSLDVDCPGVVCLVSCFLVLPPGDALQSGGFAGLAFLERFQN